MPIRRLAQDGTVQTFPDGTSPDAVQFAMTAHDNRDTLGALAGKIGEAVGQVGEPVAAQDAYGTTVTGTPGSTVDPVVSPLSGRSVTIGSRSTRTRTSSRPLGGLGTNSPI